MKVLWRLGQATVHQIRAEIEPRRLLAYTTVMTVMDRLAQKAVVRREKRGRQHLYHPAIEETAIRSRAVEKLIDNFFSGSRQELIEYLRGASNGKNRTDGPSALSDVAVRRPVPSPMAAVDDGIDPSLL